MTRVGLIARADRTGLGVQTWNFWKHVQPDATLIVDLHNCSGQHPDLSLYAGDPGVSVWPATSYPSITPTPDPIIERFLDAVDVVFTCETPYNMWLFQRAREKGVRTVLQPNYEFFEYLLYPDLPEPDVFALPSRWRWDDIHRAMPGREILHLPVPVDRQLLPYRHRPTLHKILHTAGTPAMEDRNGSIVLMKAMSLVRSPITAVVKTQKHLGFAPPANVVVDDSPVRNYWELYGDEDLYVLPRKFGGLCLPLQEALAVGMPVLASDCDPQNQFLPAELLVDAPVVKEIMTRAMIDVHEVDAAELAQRIDWLYEHPDEFSSLSQWTEKWADHFSWEHWLPAYRNVLDPSF